jgi:hypothetical protein
MTEPSPVDGLDAAVAEEIQNGGRLKSRTPGDAVIVYGSGNVLMHLTFACLTLITPGFFVFPSSGRIPTASTA